MRGKVRRRKYIGVKIWELGVKIRELPGNGRTKKSKLYYKSVVLLYIHILHVIGYVVGLYLVFLLCVGFPLTLKTEMCCNQLLVF